MSYASDTAVPVERSQREIEQLVLKAGATSFYRGMDGDKAVIGFQIHDRRILFELPLPKLEQFATFKKNGRTVKAADWFQQKMFDQAVKAKWRALALTIKAKLVSVGAGVEAFEESFLAQIIVPHDGRAARFGAIAMKSIAESYKSGKPLPPMLESGTDQTPEGKR